MTAKKDVLRINYAKTKVKRNKGITFNLLTSCQGKINNTETEIPLKSEQMKMNSLCVFTFSYLRISFYMTS